MLAGKIAVIGSEDENSVLTQSAAIDHVHNAPEFVVEEDRLAAIDAEIPDQIGVGYLAATNKVIEDLHPRILGGELIRAKRRKLEPVGRERAGELLRNLD